VRQNASITRYCKEDLDGSTIEYIHPLCKSCHEAVEFDSDGDKVSMKQAIFRFAEIKSLFSSKRPCPRVSRQSPSKKKKVHKPVRIDTNRGRICKMCQKNTPRKGSSLCRRCEKKHPNLLPGYKLCSSCHINQARKGRNVCKACELRFPSWSIEGYDGRSV